MKPPATQATSPVVIRVGNVRVKMYCVPWGGKKRWEVRDRFGGKIHRKKFTKKVKALLWANERAVAMCNGASAKHRLTEAQAIELEQALLVLQPTGKTLIEVAYEERARWTAAQKLAPANSPLLADVVTEFLADKAQQELSPYYVRDFRLRLARLVKAFHCPINRLTTADLQEWLGTLNGNARTRNNFRGALAALYKFALGRKYVTEDCVAGIELVKLRHRAITIFTPHQMSMILSGASERLLPALAISAFAGLRSEEVLRLNWTDFKWEKGYIYLREEVTKTRRQRTVPILDNLVDWLKPWSQASGRVCDYANLSMGKCNLARRLGLRWSRNALRDSFISYRVAATQNVAQVALEAGNSPGMIHRYYLELTTPGEALKWFEIRPKTVTQNVLPLKFR